MAKVVRGGGGGGGGGGLEGVTTSAENFSRTLKNGKYELFLLCKK